VREKDIVKGKGDRREPGWLGCLRARARLLEEVPELERRRIDLISAVAQRSGVRPGVLGVAFDLALEVGLDPVLALEMVGCGVTVEELAEPEPVEDTLTPAPPEWINPPFDPPAEVAFDRRLRLTFRRMRTCLEESMDLETAITAFVAAPDVGPYAYDPPSL
jgi:hypothetical protein